MVDLDNISKIIDNNIRAKELKLSKALPEYVPRLKQTINVEYEEEDEEEDSDVAIKDTCFRPVPLPEKPNSFINNNMACVQINNDNYNNNNNNSADDDTETMNSEEEQRTMDGSVYHTELGASFSGEFFKRLRASRLNNDCAYYYYAYDLFATINVGVIVEGINKLMAPETKSVDWKPIIKWIIDYLALSNDQYSIYWMNQRMMNIIEAKIIMALLHIDIKKEYMVDQIHIQKLTKINCQQKHGLCSYYISYRNLR